MTPALIFEDRTIGCDAMHERVLRAASALRALGITSADTVALMLRNTPYVVELMLALRWLGATWCPINWHFKHDELRYILSDCGARLFIAEAALLRELHTALPEGVIAIAAGDATGDIDMRWPRWDTLRDAAAPYGGAAGTPRGPMLYTSGTTGKPKGAIRNHEGLAVISLVTALDMGLSCDDTALLVMPMCHANSLYFGCSFAYIGATVVVDDSKHFSPEALLATIASREITFTSLVPTHFIMALGLAEEVKARYDVSRIRKLMISSAPARKDTKLAILEYFRNSQLYELYGSTEAGWVTLLRPDEQIEHLGSVGREWTGSGPVRILDPYGNEVSDGEVGELFSCTPYTFDGYFNDPAKTAEALRADGYCSVGDLARRDEHGFIHLVDRKSNMIISGGENIYPSEIENLLGRYPGIKDVAVVGVPHEKWGEAVHAVIVMHDGSTADERDVLDWCRDKVAGYKRPRSVSFIAESEMPRTATGKIQHRVLRDRYAKAKA
jgi:acyl-CoA synthetase (AMP-forming)/AMP-acid ligase II